MLSCRPSEAETTLAYAGLSDLLDGVVEEVLPALPPVQRRALEVALLLGESEAKVDERAVAAAFLAALRSLAVDQPLCVAVDDLQWLDAASLATLRFALSRLDDEPLAALLTVRGDPPSWLRRALRRAESSHVIEIGGLSIGAMHELLRARLDATLRQADVRQALGDICGKPVLRARAGERAAATRRHALPPVRTLPITSTLDELLRERLDGSARPHSMWRAWLPLRRAVGGGDRGGARRDVRRRARGGARGARSRARRASASGSRIRCSAPQSPRVDTPSRRRSLHARLAEVVPNAGGASPASRARHSPIRATTSPRRSSAAAQSAHARGATAGAAELTEHALRLTTAGRSRRRPTPVFLTAARMHAGGR